jgi:acyl carrier protein
MPVLLDLLHSGSGIDLTPADAATSFLELGLDSLFLTQFSVSVAKTFGLTVTFRQLSSSLNSLDKLAAHLAANGAKHPTGASIKRPLPKLTPAMDPVSAPCSVPALPRASAQSHPDPLIRLFLAQIDILQQQLDALSAGLAGAENQDTSVAQPMPDPMPPAVLNPDVVLDAARPPHAGARLGRDPSGKPAWFVPKPGHPGKYVKAD